MKRIAHQILSGEGGFAGREQEGACASATIHILLMAGLLLLSGCSRHWDPPLRGGRAVPSTVAVAEATNVPVQVQATGQVKALATAAVQSQVDGVLERVCFQEGDEVKKGSLLFSIDPLLFQAALKEAMADMERDKAMTRCEEIKARRNAELANQGTVPSCANPVGLAAAVAADEAAVQHAQLQRSFCDIRSPINGRTGLVTVNASEWVKKLDTVLVTITQTKPVYVDFPVPEQELPGIRACLAAAGNLPVTASVPGGEQTALVGQLTITNYAVGADTGRIYLRAVFPNQDEMLLPGERVNVHLTLSTVTNAVVVPSPSVRGGQQGQYVLVVKPDSTVEARPVEVGNQVGSVTVLRSGLESGEQVVTGSQRRLASGMKVRIENPIAVVETANRGSSE